MASIIHRPHIHKAILPPRSKGGSALDVNLTRSSNLIFLRQCVHSVYLISPLVNPRICAGLSAFREISCRKNRKCLLLEKNLIVKSDFFDAGHPTNLAIFLQV